MPHENRKEDPSNRAGGKIKQNLTIIEKLFPHIVWKCWAAMVWGACQIKETNKMRKNKRKIHSAHKSGEKKKKSRN